MPGASIDAGLDGTGSSHAAPGTNLSYSWTGDFVGGTATGVRPTVQFTTPGVHTVGLVVSDGVDTDSDTVRITVLDDLSPQTKSPRAAVNGGSFYGSIAWKEPRGVLARAGNDAVGQPVSQFGLSLTESLKATEFGFQIPINARVTGVRVSIRRRADQVLAPDADLVYDHHVQLLKNGASGGSDRKKNAAWSTNYVAAGYGGATDLWGRSWTPAEINAKGFGVALQVEMPETWLARSARVDHITITVTYEVDTP
jgi:PKD repeat protein